MERGAGAGIRGRVSALISVKERSSLYLMLFTRGDVKPPAQGAGGRADRAEFGVAFQYVCLGKAVDRRDARFRLMTSMTVSYGNRAVISSGLSMSFTLSSMG